MGGLKHKEKPTDSKKTQSSGKGQMGGEGAAQNWTQIRTNSNHKNGALGKIAKATQSGRRDLSLEEIARRSQAEQLEPGNNIGEEAQLQMEVDPGSPIQVSIEASNSHKFMQIQAIQHIDATGGGAMMEVTNSSNPDSLLF